MHDTVALHVSNS